MFCSMESTSSRKCVVAGLIQNAEGHVLISQRTTSQSHPGLWEFPGGKIEPRESPEEALQRELKEELGIEATVGRIYDVVFHRYTEYDVLLLVYHCFSDETPKPIEVAKVAWVPVPLLHTYSFLPADLPILDRLQREHAPAR